MREVALADVRPVIEAGAQRRFGAVTVDLTDDGHQIVATVVPMDVDPVKLQLDRLSDPVVSLDMLGPFPVRVDRATNRTLPDVVPIPPGSWVIVADLPVRLGAEDLRVVRVRGDRVFVTGAGCDPQRVYLPPGPDADAQDATAAASAAKWFPFAAAAVFSAALAVTIVRRRGRRA